MDPAQRLKDLEKENARLKRLLADAELDKAVLREATSADFGASSKTPGGRALLGVARLDVAPKLTSDDVLERLAALLVRRGVPEHIRSDTRSEFTAKQVREWRASA